MAEQNAFTMVRPRGPDRDIPALPPRKTNRSTAPMRGTAPAKAMDRNGRFTVDIAPRTMGSIVIEGRERGAASVANAQRIKGAKR